MSDVGNALLGRPTQNPATRFTPTAPNPMLGTRQMPNALQLPPAAAPPPMPFNPATVPPAPAPAAPPAPAPTPGVADRVSTRIPTAKGQDFDPHERSDLTINHEAMQPDFENPSLKQTKPEKRRDVYHRTIQKVREMYPHVAMANMPNHEAAEAFIRHVHDNVNFLWGAARNKPWFNEARNWYHGANQFAKGMADEHGVTHRQAAAVIAALSPQTEWNKNVERAHRTLRILRDEKDTPFDEGMRQYTQTIIGNTKNDKVRSEKQRLLDAIPEGAKLRDLDKLHAADDFDKHFQKAYFVRAHDQLYNADRAFPIVAPNGEKFDSGKEFNWGSYHEIAQAAKAAHSDNLKNISESLGLNHKVRNFYNNIIAPDAPHGDVTIDTHAIRAGQLMPTPSKHIYIQHGLGTGGGMPENADTGAHGLYALYADAYRRAAQTISHREGRRVLPREVQSATWEAVKGLFNNAGHMKMDAEGEPTHEVGKVAKYFQVLARHHAPFDEGPHVMTMPRARGALYRAAGGINNPEWFDLQQQARNRGAA